MTPIEWFKSLPVDAQVTVVGFVGALFAFAIGLWRYWTTQRWKRAEWAAAEAQRFLNDPAVRRALVMIDWFDRRILLFPDHPNPARRTVRVNDDIVARALLSHNVIASFTPVEAAIRDTFDVFLDGLSRLQLFVEAGLVNRRDIDPYIAYWIRAIGSAPEATVPVARLRQLHQYIHDYGFNEAKRLIESAGHSLTQQPAAELDRLAGLDSTGWRDLIGDPLMDGTSEDGRDRQPSFRAPRF